MSCVKPSLKILYGLGELSETCPILRKCALYKDTKILVYYKLLALALKPLTKLLSTSYQHVFLANIYDVYTNYSCTLCAMKYYEKV